MLEKIRELKDIILGFLALLFIIWIVITTYPIARVWEKWEE